MRPVARCRCCCRRRRKCRTAHYHAGRHCCWVMQLHALLHCCYHCCCCVQGLCHCRLRPCCRYRCFQATGGVRDFARRGLAWPGQLFMVAMDLPAAGVNGGTIAQESVGLFSASAARAVVSGRLASPFRASLQPIPRAAVVQCNILARLKAPGKRRRRG